MTSVLNVEQRSREMLVMWIAFCLVHQKCVDEVPLCAEYNIALDWNGLKWRFFVIEQPFLHFSVSPRTFVAGMRQSEELHCFT
ncbi:hypothetical protein GQ600_27834 [Phytophthora cactorum]|nr:hypothetical protein GQ600_27834 [Phytophthora cactorum]